MGNGRREEIILLQQQLKQKQNERDYKAAAAVARNIASKAPRNRALWEQLLAVFIDGECLADAHQAMSFMEEHFKPVGYWQVLKAQIAYLSKDYEAVIRYGEDALQKIDLLPWQKALAYNILAAVYLETDEVEKVAACYRAAVQLPNRASIVPEYSNMLFALHYREIPQADLAAITCGYNRLFADIVPYSYRQPYNHSKLRVGYVSADFRLSVVAFFFFSMLTYYDKCRFEVYAYANCKEDAVSNMLAANVTVWRNIYNLSPVDAAAVIHADELDILFDTSGHTADNCLPIMAYKPAPVQLCGVGWWDSTGLKAIDYFLTDRYVDPPGKNDEFFTEKLLRLSSSHFCYSLHNTLDHVPTAPCLSNGYITFGTLNKFGKVTDRMLRIWAKVLARVPGSRLYLKSMTFDVELAKQKAIHRIQAAGIDMNRVDLEGFSKDYLHAYSRIDIALDTFPYPGGTTTCDALYTGVPVVTLAGQNHNARFGYSLLKNMGLEEFIATTDEDYIEICCNLAANTARINELHQTLRWRMNTSPLMDDAAYMTELELIYEKIALNMRACPRLEEITAQEQAADWDAVIRSCSALLAAEVYPEYEAVLWGRLGVAYLMRNGLSGRARFCLKNALQKGVKGVERIRLLCYLSDSYKDTFDYVRQYAAIHEAVTLLREGQRGNLDTAWVVNMHNNCANAALQLGYYEEAEQEFRLAAAEESCVPDKLGYMSSMLLVSHYLPYTSEEIWQRQQEYAVIASKVQPLPPIRYSRGHGEKIKIGYLSPDFRNHAMFPILYGLFAYANSEKFSVTGYQLNKENDDFTARLKQMANEWKDISALKPAEAAAVIREDNIDILVELASHSRGNGLPILLYSPARIQVSGLGSLCTSGVPAVDYYITDSCVDPPKETGTIFVEQPLYLPAQFAYAGREDLLASSGTPCKESGYVQFGVFQQYPKLNDEMLELWREILIRVPQSRLLVKSISFDSDSLLLTAYQRFQKNGLPMERVSLESGDEHYMERMLDVDVMLDTYPYTGGRTTLDALYMGVPVVSRYGKRRNTRFGLSVLHSLGLDELAVSSAEEYVKLAVRLAKDKDLLDLLHKNLRSMMQNSEAMSPKAYTRNLENAYTQMLEKRKLLAD